MQRSPIISRISSQEPSSIHISPVASTSRIQIRETPAQTYAASQQAHIEDLAQQKRTLETVNSQLRTMLSDEQSRAEAAMQEIKVKWVAEIESWKETVAAVGAFHHLAHLRTLGLLQAAQSDALLVKQDRRKENLGRIERDFRLMQFQTRVEDLNDVVTQSDVDLDEMEAALHAKSAAYDASIVELQKLQSKYSELKRDDVEKTAELKSVQSVLEKTSLQLTSANTIKKSLQTTIDALKSESAEYKQELNKREALESKGGEEVDNLRRQKMDLEVRLKEAISRSEKDASKLEKNKEALNKLTRAHKDVEEQLQEEKDRREMAEHKARKIESKMKILNMLKEVEEEEEGTEEEADIVEVPSYPPPNTKRDIRGKAEKDNGKRKAQDEGANDVQEVPSKPRIKANTIAADEKAAKKVKTVKASKTLAISSVPEAKLQQPAKKKRRIQIGAMAGPSSQILSSLARLPEDSTSALEIPTMLSPVKMGTETLQGQRSNSQRSFGSFRDRFGKVL